MSIRKINDFLLNEIGPRIPMAGNMAVKSLLSLLPL